MEQSLNRLVQALWGGSEDQKPSDIYTELLIKRLNCRRDAFSVAVDNAVAEKLEPYCECTEDPRYLEFVDKTEELTTE